MIVVRHDRSLRYPKIPPFHPSEVYPEYPFGHSLNGEENMVYRGIRSLFNDLQLDSENFGTPEWNPLGDLVSPGGNVVVKPNWVWDPPDGLIVPGRLEATITHSSLIRSIIDYALIAVGEKGRITILDSPVEGADWRRLHTWNGFWDVLKFYKNNTRTHVELFDIRDFQIVRSGISFPINGISISLIYRRKLRGDPRGYVEFDLLEESEFENNFTHHKLLRSPQAWTKKHVQRYHSPGHHKYQISKSILEADLIINIPKLKHHVKAGVTLSLKNLVGATQEKVGLPHFKAGAPPMGDEYPYPKSYRHRIREGILDLNLAMMLGILIERRKRKKDDLSGEKSQRYFERLLEIRCGDWYGSDVLWRTILDLNKTVLCGDLQGKVHRERQRQYISIIDGIIGGEKQSPMHPSPRKAGLMLSSRDPVALDIVATYLMGFDPEKIPTLINARAIKEFDVAIHDPENNVVVLNGSQKIALARFRQFLIHNPEYLTRFTPSVGWRGHIELTDAST